MRSGEAIRGVLRPKEERGLTPGRTPSGTRAAPGASLIPSLLPREPTGTTGKERLHPGLAGVGAGPTHSTAAHLHSFAHFTLFSP